MYKTQFRTLKAIPVCRLWLVLAQNMDYNRSLTSAGTFDVFVFTAAIILAEL